MHVNITTWIRTEVSLPKTFITIGIVTISSSGTVQTKHGTQAQCFPASALCGSYSPSGSHNSPVRLAGQESGCHFEDAARKGD